MWRGLARGAAAGALWGVVARLFMRLLTDDPHFSWEGTLGILGIATVVGLCVGLVHAARVTGRSGWWRLAALPGLLLFAGPGSLLLPAAVGMTMVLRGRPVVRVVGALFVALSPVVVVTSPPVAPTPVQLAGLALMVLSAAPLGLAIGEVFRSWRVTQPQEAAPPLGSAVAPALV